MLLLLLLLLMMMMTMTMIKLNLIGWRKSLTAEMLSLLRCYREWCYRIGMQRARRRQRDWMAAWRRHWLLRDVPSRWQSCEEDVVRSSQQVSTPQWRLGDKQGHQRQRHSRYAREGHEILDWTAARPAHEDSLRHVRRQVNLQDDPKVTIVCLITHWFNARNNLYDLYDVGTFRNISYLTHLSTLFPSTLYNKVAPYEYWEPSKHILKIATKST